MKEVLPQFVFSDYPAQIFWFLLSFVVLYFVLTKVILPRIEHALELRNSCREQDIRSARQTQKQIEHLQERHFDLMKSAQIRSEKILVDANLRINTDLQAAEQALASLIDLELKRCDQNIRDKVDAVLVEFDQLVIDVSVSVLNHLSIPYDERQLYERVTNLVNQN